MLRYAAHRIQKKAFFAPRRGLCSYFFLLSFKKYEHRKSHYVFSFKKPKHVVALLFPWKRKAQASRDTKIFLVFLRDTKRRVAFCGPYPVRIKTTNKLLSGIFCLLSLLRKTKDTRRLRSTYARVPSCIFSEHRKSHFF